MKKFLSLMLVLSLVLGLCACGDAKEEQPTEQPKETQQQTETQTPTTEPADTMLVGFGREKIQPEGPVALSGGGDPNRISENVLDFLYVTCVAITDASENTVLVITQDLQSTNEGFSGNALNQIATSLGIPRDHIFLCSTHNHSGPSQSLNRTGIKEFQTIYNAGILSAAEKAMADRAPATIEAGSVQADGLVFTRHYKMMDGTYAGSSYGNLVVDQIESHAYDADTTLQMIRFVREGKKPVLMMNLGAHATFFSSTSIKNLSTDFPGPMRTHIENNSDCLVAYFIGAAGDQTPNSKFKEFDHNMDYKAYGQAVGQLVVDNLGTLKPMEGGQIQAKQMKHVAKTNKKGVERVAEAQEVYDIYLEQGYSAGNAAAYSAGFISVYDARSIVNRSKMPMTQPIELAALSFGDVSLIFASFEMFGDSGRYIRENSPYEMTFISTLSLESHDYIPSDIGFELNCYEAYTAYFEQNTIKDLSEVYLNTLKEMKGQ